MKISRQRHGSAPLDEAQKYLQGLLQSRRAGTAAQRQRCSVLVLAFVDGDEPAISFSTVRYAGCAG